MTSKQAGDLIRTLKRFFEFVDGLAQGPADLGKLVRSKDQKTDQKNDQQFLDADAENPHYYLRLILIVLCGYSLRDIFYRFNDADADGLFHRGIGITG